MKQENKENCEFDVVNPMSKSTGRIRNLNYIATFL